jgi:ABC-type transporter Mla subunit MlaD
MARKFSTPARRAYSPADRDTFTRESFPGRAVRTIDIETELRQERQDLLRALDKERQLRLQAEEAPLVYREESLRREMEFSKTVQEADLKLSRALGDKSRLSSELAKSQERLSQSQRDSADKIKNLSEQVTQLQRLLKQQDADTKSSIGRSHSDHSQELKQLARSSKAD